MSLYTIEIDGRPAVVLAAGLAPVLPPELAKDPKIVEAQAATEHMLQRIKDEAVQRGYARATEFQHVLEIHEIDEAVDAWLADELVLRSGWTGDRDQVHVRPATDAEKAFWREFAAREIVNGLPAEDEHDTVLFLEVLDRSRR